MISKYQRHWTGFLEKEKGLQKIKDFAFSWNYVQGIKLVFDWKLLKNKIVSIVKKILMGANKKLCKFSKKSQ